MHHACWSSLLREEVIQDGSLVRDSATVARFIPIYGRGPLPIWQLVTRLPSIRQMVGGAKNLPSGELTGKCGMP